VSATHFSQAGLLTHGSSYRPRLPNENISGVIAAFVPDYSGGPAPDSHGVPFTAPWEHLDFFAQIYPGIHFFVKRFSSLCRRPSWIFISTISLFFAGETPAYSFLFHCRCARARCDVGTGKPIRYGIGGAIQGENNDKKAKGSQSFAVGSEAYIKKIKEVLGFKARGRKIRQVGDSFELRETLTPFWISRFLRRR